jgi:hypothetical protein
MKSKLEVCTALFTAAVLASGCQPSNDQAPPEAVPAGAIPAAPDVRPGPEMQPGSAMPDAGGMAGDQAMPQDTVQGATGGTGVDTVGMRRP